jgi:transmembrane sensor
MTDQDRSQNNPPNPDWDTLARFIAGECTPDESRELERTLEADPAHASLLHALDAAVRAPDPAPPTAAEIESALLSVRARATDARQATVPRRSAMVSLDAYRSRWRDARLAAAAAVLVVAGAGLIWRTAVSPSSARLPAGTKTEFATAVGVLDSLQLPDGTRVLLGPGSELALAPDFGAVTRELTLKGEARFEVAHDASHQFIVHAGTVSFRDVGTVFAVHSDEAEGARIVVNEGAVAVQSHPGSDAVTLKAGDRALVAPDGAVRVERGAASTDDLAWTGGRLVFRDAPVAQVSADLRRWYGIELRVDSALATRHLRADFDRSWAASDVGRVVAAALGGALREENGVLHIVPQAAAKPAK